MRKWPKLVSLDRSAKAASQVGVEASIKRPQPSLEEPLEIVGSLQRAPILGSVVRIHHEETGHENRSRCTNRPTALVDAQANQRRISRQAEST
jgi:hypothetical protein